MVSILINLPLLGLLISETGSMEFVVYFEFILLPGERTRALSWRGVHVDDRTESSSFLYLEVQIWFDLIVYHSIIVKILIL